MGIFGIKPKLKMPNSTQLPATLKQSKLNAKCGLQIGFVSTQMMLQSQVMESSRAQ